VKKYIFSWKKTRLDMPRCLKEAARKAEQKAECCTCKVYARYQAAISCRRRNLFLERKTETRSSSLQFSKKLMRVHRVLLPRRTTALSRRMSLDAVQTAGKLSPRVNISQSSSEKVSRVSTCQSFLLGIPALAFILLMKVRVPWNPSPCPKVDRSESGVR